MACERDMGNVTQATSSLDFEALYNMYQPRIAGYLCRMVSDPDVAADLTQDVFFKAYRAIDRDQPPLNAKAWLFTIATNAARDYHRHHRLLKWLPLGDSDNMELLATDSGVDPQNRFAAREELEAALTAVPKDQLACLLLHARDGFSFDEIAAMLDISSGAAKTRAYRARWTIARLLRQRQEGAR